MAVILTRTNIAFQRPAWENLRIDPQAPEAQNLYAAGAVPSSRTPGQITGITLPYADKTPYQWPIAYTAALGSAGDSLVGSYIKASGTSTKYTITLTNPPPNTTEGTLAVWVRLRGALTAGQQIASLPSPVALQIGTDVTTPLIFIWNNALASTATNLILPLDEWALAVGTHKDGRSTTYLFSPGTELRFGYSDTNVSRRVPTVAAGGTGSTSTGADYADVAFWARAFTPPEVYALWDPQTRWRRYYVPKTYWQFGDTPVADTQPLAAQPPRPKYIRLNTFSPQANGLYAWMPVIDGSFVQTNTPGFSNALDGDTTLLSNVPNQPFRRARFTQTNPGTDATAQVPATLPGDFGTAPLSFKTIDNAGKRQMLGFRGLVDLSRLTDFTVVYWIYPFPSLFTEAGYWQLSGSNVESTSEGVTVDAQTLTFASDTHIAGRWQMVTVSRTLAGISVYRDQTLVASVQSAGAAINTESSAPTFWIGRGTTTRDGVVSTPDGVNALWADFRIYNRAWNQGDVNYAYNPATRWDYYYKPKTTPYEDIPIIPPPGSGFLSRLALMGAG